MDNATKNTILLTKTDVVKQYPFTWNMLTEFVSAGILQERVRVSKSSSVEIGKVKTRYFLKSEIDNLLTNIFSFDFPNNFSKAEYHIINKYFFNEAHLVANFNTDHKFKTIAKTKVNNNSFQVRPIQSVV